MIDREKVINDLQDAVNDDWMWRHADYYALTMERAIALLKERPEIIRCNDCKWWHESETHKGYGNCGQANGIALKSSDWFCADGQR